MSAATTKLTPCLWFTDQASEAATFYTSIFPNSSISHVDHYPDTGTGVRKVLTVAFTLNGQSFLALNGGASDFKFTEAVSFQVECTNQEEVDHYWSKLGEEGGGTDGRCGWLKDRFELSWQVVPKQLKEILGNHDREGAGRAMKRMMGMKKLDVEELQAALKG